LKKKRDDQYKAFGLELEDKTLTIERMPLPLQQAYRKHQEALVKLAELKKSSANMQELAERCQSDFNKGS
jgi:hypothetical protein